METVGEQNTALKGRLYEGLFLIDSALAAADWEGVNATITAVLKKFGAEIVSMKKWDETRLAYEIRGKSRGTYILCYFRAEGASIREIERSIQLSGQIMRVLILNAEHMSAEDIEKGMPDTETKDISETAESQEVPEDIKEASDDVEDIEMSMPDMEVKDTGETAESQEIPEDIEKVMDDVENEDVSEQV